MNATLEKTVKIPGTDHTVKPSPLFPTEEFTDICGLRSTGTWGKFQAGHNHPFGYFSTGVLVGVEFEARYHASGCGGEYTGHAKGALYEDGKFEGSGLRRLYFDSCSGDFKDAETDEALARATVLVLGKNLHAEYLP